MRKEKRFCGPGVVRWSIRFRMQSNCGDGLEIDTEKNDKVKEENKEVIVAAIQSQREKKNQQRSSIFNSDTESNGATLRSHRWK